MRLQSGCPRSSWASYYALMLAPVGQSTLQGRTPSRFVHRAFYFKPDCFPLHFRGLGTAFGCITGMARLKCCMAAFFAGFAFLLHFIPAGYLDGIPAAGCALAIIAVSKPTTGCFACCCCHGETLSICHYSVAGCVDVCRMRSGGRLRFADSICPNSCGRVNGGAGLPSNSGELRILA